MGEYYSSKSLIFQTSSELDFFADWTRNRGIMASSKTVPGRCKHCGALFEVPAEAIGMATECPHCHQQTEVLLAVSVSIDAGVSRKMVIWTVVGILVLVSALIAAIFAVHMARKLMEEKRARQKAEIGNIQHRTSNTQHPMQS